jgi:hypothetical protein
VGGTGGCRGGLVVKMTWVVDADDREALLLSRNAMDAWATAVVACLLTSGDLPLVREVVPPEPVLRASGAGSATCFLKHGRQLLERFSSGPEAGSVCLQMCAT